MLKRKLALKRKLDGVAVAGGEAFATGGAIGKAERVGLDQGLDRGTRGLDDADAAFVAFGAVDTDFAGGNFFK